MPQTPRHTLFSELTVEQLAAGGASRFGQLFVESFLLMLAALCLPFFLGLKQSGIIGLFLVSATLMERFQGLMDENRENIWVYQLGGWRANGLSALSVLAIFLGLFFANGLFAYVVFGFTSLKATHVFGPILQVVQSDVALTHRIASFGGILVNNAAVLLTMILITFLFRVYGMILVLGWNACVWGVVWTFLLQRAFATTDLPTGVYVARAAMGILPHIVLEVTAYILGGLGGVFLSKGLSAYAFSDHRFKQVSRAVVLLLTLAISFVLLGAVAEVWYAPLFLSGL